MKNVIIFVSIFIFSIYAVFGQNLKPINYQAVARDASNSLLTNRQVSLRLSILKDSPTGSVVYIETHSTSTNDFGLFTLQISTGAVLTGNFNSIDWSAADYFLKVEMDANGGSAFIEVGTSKLLAVPYAYFAEKSRLGDADSDPENELQTLSVNGNQLSISDGNTVTLPNTTSGGDNWGTQTVATNQTLEGKGTLGEPLKIAGQNASAGEVLIWDGDSWIPGPKDDADADPNNEIQTLSITDNTLSISSGNSVELPAASGGAENIDELTDGKSEGMSVFLGAGAGDADDGNNNNTAVGYEALLSNTTAKENTAIGSRALTGNISGEQNTAVGYHSLLTNSIGNGNTAIGDQALAVNSDGHYNVAIGLTALQLNTEGCKNIAIGVNTLMHNTSGNFNTANGYAALTQNISGTYNTADGAMALYNNTTGNSNVAVGKYALYKNTDRSNLVAVGDSALCNNGQGAASSTQSIENTAIGSKALYSNTKGSYNTAVGYNSLMSNITGLGNTAVGNVALKNTSTGDNNTAIGQSALRDNTSGNNNTAIGYGSLVRNTSGEYNTAIGISSLQENRTGEHNTAIGYWSLIFNTTGNTNTACGGGALHDNTTGTSNVAIGINSLYNNKTASNLVAVGDSALFYNGEDATETYHARYNTAVGSKALFENTNGYENTAIGYRALTNNTSGYFNTALGYNAGSSQTIGDHNIYINNSGTTGESNVIKIGDVQTKCYIKGIYDATAAPSANIYVSSSGQLMRSTSSARYKENIKDLSINTENIYNLRPVTYKSKSDGKIYFGLIAEEVVKVLPELVEYAIAKDVIPGSDSEELIPDAVQYPMLSVLLLNELKKQKATNDELIKRIETLEQKILTK